MPELKWPEIPYTQNPWPGLIFSNHVCYCGAVVKELLAYAYKPGSTPGDAVFCFFVPVFFFSLVSFFNTSFPKSLKYILIQVHDQQVQQ